MSHQINDALNDEWLVRVGQWLEERGYSENDLRKDDGGYYLMMGAKFCTNQEGFCEPEQKCDCKEKVYLPANLQTL